MKIIQQNVFIVNQDMDLIQLQEVVFFVKKENIQWEE